MIGTGIFLKPSEMAAERADPQLSSSPRGSSAACSHFSARLATPSSARRFPKRAANTPICAAASARLGLPLRLDALHRRTPRFGRGHRRRITALCGFVSPCRRAPIYTFHFPLPFLPRISAICVYLGAAAGRRVRSFCITFINYLGVRLGGQVQIALTFIKVASVPAIIFFGFCASRTARASNFHTTLARTARLGERSAVSSPLWPRPCGPTMAGRT